MSELLPSRNLGHELAAALQAIDDEHKRFCDLKADHKSRIEGLTRSMLRLKMDILTGQGQLPLEEVPGEERPLEILGPQPIVEALDAPPEATEATQ